MSSVEPADPPSDHKAQGEISASFADLTFISVDPGQTDAVADSNRFMILLSPQRRKELAVAGTRLVTFDAPSGSIQALPKGADYHVRWRAHGQSIFLSIDDGQMEEFATREFNAGRVDVRLIRPGTIDTTAMRIASLIRDEFVRTQDASRLYRDSLKTALLFHFLRNHSSLSEQSAYDKFRGGLAPQVWRDVEDFIRQNLAFDMALSELVSRTGLSYSHFLRAFRQTAGVSPHRYIMLLRVEEARRLAASGAVPLKQIATQCGFASQSHMTTAMRRLLNLTPGEIRRQSGAGNKEES